MKIRLLLAVSDEQCAEMLHTMLSAALHMVPIEVETSRTDTREGLMEQVIANRVDVVFLDWELAHEETPSLVHDIAGANEMVRIVNGVKYGLSTSLFTQDINLAFRSIRGTLHPRLFDRLCLDESALPLVALAGL